jgi:hypothetical protein
MGTSFVHFCHVTDRILKNSWWQDNYAPGKAPPSFEFSVSNGVVKITEVPEESFRSLLVDVRKLTMAEAPENLLRVRKQLKAMATTDQHKLLLEAWQKYWRLAFIKEPFEVRAAGQQHLMTPYRAYNCFINGEMFHSNDPTYNILLYGSAQPLSVAESNLFLRNIFQSTVVNLCFAGLGLRWYIDSKDSPEGFVIAGHAPTVVAFVWERNRTAELDEQYRIFGQWIEEHGGCEHGRWGN